MAGKFVVDMSNWWPWVSRHCLLSLMKLMIFKVSGSSHDNCTAASCSSAAGRGLSEPTLLVDEPIVIGRMTHFLKRRSGSFRMTFERATQTNGWVGEKKNCTFCNVTSSHQSSISTTIHYQIIAQAAQDLKQKKKHVLFMFPGKSKGELILMPQGIIRYQKH